MFLDVIAGNFRPVTTKRIEELAKRIEEAGGVIFNNPGMVRPATESERGENPGKNWVIIGGNTRAVVLPI